MFGLLGAGRTRVENPNPGRDAESTLRCCEQLGALVTRSIDAIELEGRDGALAEPEGVLDCGNSGTTLRLLSGIVASQAFVSVLSGDASLNRRPVARIREPLVQMGATLWARGGDAFPPLSIRGAKLRGIDYALPVASAQVASCILLAGLGAEGTTTVRIPGPARDHTERMLKGLGVRLTVTAEGAGRSVSLAGASRFSGTSLRVPGDPSAAAFMLAAAAITPGARVTARGVSVNATRTGFLDALEAMGATVERVIAGDAAGEPAADVTVQGPERLRAIELPDAWLPRMIDEVPVWAIVAACAQGTSRLTGAGELRVKESDRLAAICRNLSLLGVETHEQASGFEVTGGKVRGGSIDAEGDHRIAMAFTILATVAGGPIVIDGAEGIGTSDPAFIGTFNALGGHASWHVHGGTR